MASDWEHQFRNRMIDFASKKPPRPDEIAFSIKVRSPMGCFHRQHSPHAYDIIDKYLHSIQAHDLNFGFEEHESGPEILIYLAITAGCLQLTAGIINLVTAIIKARSEGIKRGDGRTSPIELIVRRVDKKGKYYEETVLRYEYEDRVDSKIIEQKLHEGLTKSLDNDEK